MYVNKDILAKDELGNVWKFDNLSCTFGSETISYTMFKYIKWFGTELTLSQNGKTRIFYFDTATDAAHISEIIKSVSQNPEKYARVSSPEDDYLEHADMRGLLVETVKHQQRIDKNIKTITTILYIWIIIVIVSLVISLLVYFSAIYNISTLYSNYNGTQIENIREYNQNENQNNNPYEDDDTQSDEDYNWDDN
ncbi:MAG: hypothetical protein HXL78_02620 [[Eubacterium] sulci]|nr:hypothetical protein [[Eubacterium] sulci]MBF1160773.1 hypothetical protein [[Eubacterium] sulci]